MLNYVQEKILNEETTFDNMKRTIKEHDKRVMDRVCEFFVIMLLSPTRTHAHTCTQRDAIHSKTCANTLWLQQETKKAKIEAELDDFKEKKAKQGKEPADLGDRINKANMVLRHTAYTSVFEHPYCPEFEYALLVFFRHVEMLLS